MSVSAGDAALGVIGGTDIGVAGVPGVPGQPGLLHPLPPLPPELTEHVGLVAVLRTLPSLEVDKEKDVRMGFSLCLRLAAKPMRGPTVGGGETGGEMDGASQGIW